MTNRDKNFQVHIIWCNLTVVMIGTDCTVNPTTMRSWRPLKSTRQVIELATKIKEIKWSLGGSLYEYSIASDRSEGLSWLWSYGSWICNYLCNRCLSQPKGAKMCQIQYFSLNWLWRVLQVLLKETKWESHDHNCYYCLSDFLIWALCITNGLLAM